MVSIEPNSCTTFTESGFDILLVSGKYDMGEGSSDYFYEIIRDGGPQNMTLFTTQGEQFEQTAICDYSICKYGICWDEDGPTATACGGGGESDVPIDSPNNKIAVVGTDATLPDGWEQIFDREQKLTVSFDEEFPSNFCPGDFQSINYSISSNFICQEPTADVTFTNELTGDSNTETVTVSSDFDESFFESIDIPDDAQIGSDVDIFSIDINSSAPVDPSSNITMSADIGNPEGVISISEVDSPERTCPGEDFRLSAKLSNSGSCEQTASVNIVNDFNDEVLQSESSDIFNGSSSTFRFNPTVPEGADDVDSITYTVQGVRDGSVVSTSSFTLSVSSTDFSLVNVDSPSGACANTDFVVGIEAKNQGECDGTMRVVAENQSTGGEDIFGPDTISAGDTFSSQYETSIPSDVEGQDNVTINFRLEARAGDDWRLIDSIDSNIEVLSSDLNLSVESPAEACVSSQFTIITTARNEGDCQGRARVVARNESTGEEEVFGPDVVVAGDTFVNRLQTSLPAEVADQDTATITTILEVESQDTFEAVDSTESVIDVLTPNIQLDEDIYPDEAEPGSIEVDIQVENTGECSTAGTISGTQIDKSFEVDAGSSTTVSHMLDISTEPVDVSMSVFDSSLETTVAEVTETIFPRRFVSISTSNGVVKMVGSFDEPVDYAGSMTGTGIEGESLEESDRVAAGFINGVYKGKMSTDVTDSDIINFNSLTSLNQQVTKEVTWVVDGSIEGVAKSFNYETVTSSALSQLSVDREKAELGVVAGPMSNVGVARRRFDIGDRVVKSPFLRF